MSGIGEASAVIGVVQVGFSLARTLNTYIGDYKDSRDSIISLASELDATIIQVKELNSLIGNSKTASEGSKKLAEKCVKDSDRLVKRLVELLTKARLPEDPQAIINISPRDIIPSRLTKAYWPFVKPQVDVVKSELQVMKTDILIARSCIQSQSAATAADRTAGEESIVALARSRVIARKLLREAMAEEKRSIAAMQDSVPAPNTALFQIPAPNGVDNNTQGGSAVNSPPSKPLALGFREPNTDDASGTAAEDARITKLAQDIQASVQAELARKDEERKANQTAEEAVKKSAVEAYQKSVGDRLERLLQNTEATQRLLREVFGADLDQEKVKKFLVEQQSQQLKEEFGDMLSQFGVRPPVLHGSMVVDSDTGPTRPAVVPLSRRRWFFKRQLPRYSYGYGVDSSRASSTISRSRRSSTISNDAVDFLHIAVSFDLGEGKHSFQSYDHTILKHKPCGPDCDLQTTMRLWQTLPESVKQSVSAWVEETYSVKESDWNLHSAIPVAKNTPRTRRLLQRLVLGAAARETAGSILLILGPSERPRRLGSSTDSVRTVSSSASSSKPTSKDVKKLQAEIAELSAELKSLRATQVDAVVGADAHMPPIKFKDAIGRKFTFAWHICKTWKGMESLIKQSFLHVDVIGPHVQEGHYDLMGPDGTIILPQLWDTMVRPDWEVTMYMWPIPEPLLKKDKKTKKTAPVIEPPINFDPNGEPVNVKPFAGVNLHEFIDLDPSTSIAERKAAKKKSKDKDKSKSFNPFVEPILEAYPPMPSEPLQAVPISVEMPPMPSEPSQSASRAIDVPTKMRNAVLEERIKEIDREDFSKRHSTRSAKNIVPEVKRASAKDFNAGGGRISPTRQDYVHMEEYVLDEGAAFPEDSDAEDALLDDEALKKKMLMKYAGGVATLDEPKPPTGRSSPDRRQEMLNEERPSRAYRSRSASPASRISREHVATFKEGRANNGDDNDVER